MCETCGKPHERDDPPCDNCGGMVFQRTVSRQGLESTNVDWRCASCGKHHAKNSPPCASCGHMQFERVELEDLAPDDLGGGRRLPDTGLLVAGVVVLLAVLTVLWVLV
jgi:rubrerythrin